MTTTSAQQVRGEWNKLCRSAQQRWTDLTDEDVQSADGNIEQLVGCIQQKTGASREVIEAFLDGVMTRGAAPATLTADTMGRYAHQAGEQLRARYERADKYVRQNPSQSLAVAFGIGAAAGVIVAMALRFRLVR